MLKLINNKVINTDRITHISTGNRDQGIFFVMSNREVVGFDLDEPAKNINAVLANLIRELADPDVVEIDITKLNGVK